MMVYGVKKKVQKKQIMCTVYEAYLLVKELNHLVKIGFSKFAEARPKNVVLPGASGTHNVYVCTYHQNPKLMIANSGIASRKEFKKLVGGDEEDPYGGEVKYHHLIAKMMCNPPTLSCWQD